MFETRRATSTWVLLFNLLEVTYHTSVRKVRMGHRNALVAIAMSVFQSILFLGAFYLMFSILGAQQMAIRGDFILYLLSGIFLYLVHIQALQKVMASEIVDLADDAARADEHDRRASFRRRRSLSSTCSSLRSLVPVLYVYHIGGDPARRDRPTWSPRFRDVSCWHGPSGLWRSG
jgi:hypothetical protein